MVLHIEETHNPDFVDLSAKFACLFLQAQKLIEELIERSHKKRKVFLRKRKKEEKAAVNLEDLISYVEYFFHQDKNVIAEVSSATTVKALLSAIQKLCSSSNIYLLDKIAKDFKIEDLGELCNQYNTYVTDFCEKKILKQAFAKKLLENPLLCESVTVTFVLQWNEGTKVLEDIKKLLKKAFRGANVLVSLEVVCTGSVTVLCCCPKNLEYFLATIAHCNSQELMEEGVIYLSIGCCIVIEDIEKVL